MPFQSGNPALVMTNSRKKLKHIGIFVKDDDGEEEEEDSKEEINGKQPVPLGRGRRTAVLETKLRVSISSVCYSGIVDRLRKDSYYENKLLATFCHGGRVDLLINSVVDVFTVKFG